MNILVVTQYFWPENFKINDFAVGLVSRGHNVTVLTTLPNYPGGSIYKEFSSNPRGFDSYKGVNIVRVPAFPRFKGNAFLLLSYLSFTFSASILGPWKLRKKKVDVVFTNQLSPVTIGLIGAELAWIKNAPMAMWVLDLWPDTLHAVGVIRSQKVLSLVTKLVAFIYSQCDLILSQSNGFIPKIRNLAGPDISIEYFPSWSEKLFYERSIVYAPEITSSKNIFNIMFAGNIGEAQDFECILVAAALLKDQENIRWLIIGSGRKFSWVQSKIESLNLSNQIQLFGQYPVERMPEFYIHADAMLVTLAKEEIFSMTIPDKLQSYLAAGLPIIGALDGEGAEVIRIADAGFTCSAGDAIGLATAVKKMSELSASERKDFGKNALKYSQCFFDRDVAIERAERLLLDLQK